MDERGKSLKKVRKKKALEIVPKEKGWDILFDSSDFDARKLSKNKTKNKKHPIVHNITRRGLGLKYAKNKNHHFGTPKVLLNFNEKQTLDSG